MLADANFMQTELGTQTITVSHTGDCFWSSQRIFTGDSGGKGEERGKGGDISGSKGVKGGNRVRCQTKTKILKAFGKTVPSR